MTTLNAPILPPTPGQPKKPPVLINVVTLLAMCVPTVLLAIKGTLPAPTSIVGFKHFIDALSKPELSLPFFFVPIFILMIVNYGWWGVCAASGTPKPVLEALNRHVAAAVASSDFKSVIEKTGVIPVSSTIDEFAEIIADTAKEAGVMIKELGIEQLD